MIKTHDIHVPVSWWTMDTADISDSTLYDVSGNNNDGTIYGAVSTPGKINEALSFNVIHDYVNVPHNNSFDFADEDFSVSVWFKTTTGRAHNYIISKNYGGDGVKWYGINIIPSIPTIRCYVDDGINSSKVETTDSYDDGAWHHLVFVRNTTTNKLIAYIDGELNAESADISGSIANIGALTIGARADLETGRFFDGAIDDLRIYDYALTPEEVKMISKGETTVSWWTMDTADISDSTLYDVSGNNNDGTIYGAVSTPGKINEALSFNGNSDRVYVAHSNSIDFADEDFSVSVWFKTTTTSEFISKYIISKNYGGDGVAWYGISVYPSGPYISCYVDDGINNSQLKTTDDFNDGAWHHLVFVRNTTTNKLIAYIDGELNAESADISGSIANIGALTIGARADLDINHFFDGSIDDVRIYNYALTHEEIRTLYDIKYDIIIKNIAIIPSSELDTDTQWSVSVDVENPNDVDISNIILSFYSEEKDVFYTVYNFTVHATTTMNVKTPVFEPLLAGTYNICCIDSMVE